MRPPTEKYNKAVFFSVKNSFTAKKGKEVLRKINVKSYFLLCNYFVSQVLNVVNNG